MIVSSVHAAGAALCRDQERVPYIRRERRDTTSVCRCQSMHLMYNKAKNKLYNLQYGVSDHVLQSSEAHRCPADVKSHVPFAPARKP